LEVVVVALAGGVCHFGGIYFPAGAAGFVYLILDYGFAVRRVGDLEDVS